MHLDEFKKLVTAHKNRLFRLASWMLHNSEDAEDLVQDVFLKLWQMKEELHNYQSLEGLMVQMTKNMCLNKIKAKKTHQSDELLMTFKSPETAQDLVIEQRENLNLAKQAIQKLPDLQQIVLQLRAVEGLGTREIAELVNETDNNVRVLLSRARKSVKESFKKYYSHG